MSMATIARKLNKPKPKSDLDKALEAAIAAYLADHPGDLPERQPRPVSSLLRAFLPKPASQAPAPRAPRAPVSSDPSPEVHSSLGRPGSGALSSETASELKNSHVVFQRDELGTIKAASVNTGSRMFDVKVSRRSEEGKISELVIAGTIFKIDLDAEGRGYAMRAE